MDTGMIIVSVFLFVVSLIVIELIRYARRIYKNPDRRQIKKRLKRVTTADFEKNVAPDILKTGLPGSFLSVNRLLARFLSMDRLDMLVYQANVGVSPVIIILISICMAVVGYFFFAYIFLSKLLAIPAALLIAWLPFLFLLFKKKRRMHRFLSQLPDALELVARSLRAGHAFSSGMKLAADEFAEPLGPEFDLALEQINFGVPTTEALRNLGIRVDCDDLRFFVVAVVLQRETGGNLAEIIEKIADIVRQRFKFQDKVRVLSAEGKLSMYILVALPFLIFLAIRLLNPEYIMTLYTHPTGKILIGIAAVMMAFGVLVMRSMVRIKV